VDVCLTSDSACTLDTSEFAMSFNDIDWQRPWLAPFRQTGQSLLASGDWLAMANRLAGARELQTASGHHVLFVEQHRLPADTAYEAHIHASGQVPTRNNLHDFFNALIWLHFPRIKSALNALHAVSLTASPARPSAAPVSNNQHVRGRTRDAATLFDENAALFVCSDVQAAEALRQHQWPALLQHSPEDFFARVSVVLFGHALIEKLVRPYKSITAHVWVTTVPSAWFAMQEPQRVAALDSCVAKSLSQGFTAGDFAHLPVLGVPGWWSSQTSDFYDDPDVFRPLRQSAPPA
jgi:hypothetical protein